MDSDQNDQFVLSPDPDDVRGGGEGGSDLQVDSDGNDQFVQSPDPDDDVRGGLQSHQDEESSDLSDIDDPDNPVHVNDDRTNEEENDELEDNLMHGFMDNDDDDEIDDVPIPETYNDLVRQLGHLWVESTVKHNISIEGASYLWRIAFKYIEPILNSKKEENNDGKHPQFKHLRRKIINNSVPKVSIRTAFLNLQTNTVETPPPSEKGPDKAFNDVNKYQKLYEITSVKVKEALKIHSETCAKHQHLDQEHIEVNLSCDGVADSKSSTVSMDVFSISFPECSRVYPISIIRPTKKSYVDFKSEIRIVLEDLKQERVKILNFLGDNPMRALMRDCKNHSGYFSCEYCRSSAEYYQDPKMKKQIEHSIQNCNKRKEALVAQVQRILDNQISLHDKNINKPKIQKLKMEIKKEELEMVNLKKKYNKKVIFTGIFFNLF